MFRTFTALALSLALSACAGPLATRGSAPPVSVTIIAINDFHGALEPPKLSVTAPGSNGAAIAVPAGGAAWLASAVDSIRARNPNSVMVSAGDLISASQIASSIYLDEPAIGVMDRMGLEFNAVGNHEFDSGRAELLRKQRGGCAQFTARKPCQVEAFPGARFRFLSASTFTETGATLFPATGLKHFGRGRSKVTLGLIGLTLKGTSSLVSPDGIKGLTFGDEADAINAAVPRLKAAGADAIAVLIHQGGRTGGAPDPSGCNALDGEILPILARLDASVDIVISGHTHAAYVCDYGAIDPSRPLLLTSAGSLGQLVSEITLTIDPAMNRVTGRRAVNHIVQSPGYTTGRGTVAGTSQFPQFEPRADIAAYVKRYTDAARGFAERRIGWLAGPAARPPGQEANSGGPLGNLIADAHLAATRKAGAQIALTNPFGIRAPLNPAADGALTFGDIYRVQPFGNVLMTQTMTGAELKAALEQGLNGAGPEQILAGSAGFVWGFDRSRPAGMRVVSLELDGQPIRPDADYRVTTNSFLASGGDGFTAFTRQRSAVTGMPDIDALGAWLSLQPARAVPQEIRAVQFSP